MTDAQVKAMVDRFLTWKLPGNFAPDGGIEFSKFYKNIDGKAVTREPVGTNLFTAEQAESMIRHMIEGVA